MFDPFLQPAYRRPFAGMFDQSPTQQNQGALPPLTPEEQDTLLSRIGNGALSGLAYIGGSLDKAFGGRAVRGALAGKADELLSIIPFSDAMGITNPERSTSGAELLGNKDADLLSPEGIGGLGLEILLDPSTYLSFGAKTALGKAAEKAGVLPAKNAARIAGFASDAPELAATLGKMGVESTPENLAQYASKALGGKVGLSIPFLTDTAVSNLDGVAALADRIPGLTKAYDAVSVAADSAFRKTIGPIFHKPYGGSTDPIIQEANAAKMAARPGEMQKTIESLLPLVEHYVSNFGDRAEELRPYITDLLEGAMKPGEVALATGIPESSIAALKGLYGSGTEKNLRALQASGIEATKMVDTIASGPGAGGAMDYMTRHLSEEFRSPVTSRSAPLVPASEKGRKIGLTDGLTTRRINEFAMEEMPASDLFSMKEHIGEKYLGLGADPQRRYNQMQESIKELTNKIVNTKDESFIPEFTTQLDAVRAQARELEPGLMQAQALAEWKQKIGVAQKPIMGNDPIWEFVNKSIKDTDRILKADAFHDAIASIAVSASEAGAGAVPVQELLQKAKLTMTALAAPGQPMQATLDALNKGGKTDWSQGLNSLFVPKDKADQLLKYMSPMQTPEALKQVADVFNGITNWTRAMQVQPWPASHVRNQVEAAFQKWLTGAAAPNLPFPMNYIAPWKDASVGHTTGFYEMAQHIPEFKGLSPEDASREFAKELVTLNVLGGAGKASREGLAETGGLEALKAMVPGRDRGGLVERIKSIKDSSAEDWLQVGGVAGGFTIGKDGISKSAEDVFPLVKTGRKVASYLDDINNASAYEAFRLQGFSPLEALKKTRETHLDFTNLTDSERVLRQFLPFYNWTRQAIPQLVLDLAHNPGGRTAQSIRVSSEARGSNPGFTPEYLGDGIAAKVGEEKDGTQRFLSSVGLSVEDLGLLASGPKGLLGMLNPIIKAPLELATNRQFYTGRDLRDLQSPTGMGTAADQLLMNSPVGRFATTARTLADERKDPLAKAINLLTGVRLTDVDMNKARDIAVRGAAEDMLRGQPGVGTFQRLAVSPEVMAQLSPAEQQMLQLLRSQEARQRKAQQGR